MKSKKFKIISTAVALVLIYLCIMVVVVCAKSNERKYVGIEDNNTYFGMTEQTWTDMCLEDTTARNTPGGHICYYLKKENLFDSEVTAKFVFFEDNEKFKLYEVNYDFGDVDYNTASTLLVNVADKLSEIYGENKNYVWTADETDSDNDFSYSLDMQYFNYVITYDVKYVDGHFSLDARNLKISWFS